MTVSRAEWCRQQLDRCRSLDDLEEARANVRPHLSMLDDEDVERLVKLKDQVEGRLTFKKKKR